VCLILISAGNGVGYTKRVGKLNDASKVKGAQSWLNGLKSLAKLFDHAPRLIIFLLLQNFTYGIAEEIKPYQMLGYLDQKFN